MIETSIYIGDIRAYKGARKPVRLSVPGEKFKTAFAQVIDNFECDLIIENVSQGFVIHGNVTGEYSAQCSYGLVDIIGSFDASINELFEEEKYSKQVRNQEEDEVIYKFTGEEIDIEELLNDTIVIALPLAPKCDHGPENCAVCTSEIVPHIDKPIEGVIGGKEDVFGDKDDRWAILDELKLDD